MSALTLTWGIHKGAVPPYSCSEMAACVAKANKGGIEGVLL